MVSSTEGGGVERCFFPLYVDCVFKLMKIQFDLLLKTVSKDAVIYSVVVKR